MHHLLVGPVGQSSLNRTVIC
uniref:Uncharacterized protein n=1 Tax=Arundo donax TaxID=35708 RepID=A0A0A9B4T9_ARUDO